MKSRFLQFSLVAVGVMALGCSKGSPDAAAAPRDIGLVFSSGGCKGAYHLGVWRALVEVGLTNRVGAISGTSIGALCSALFASTGDPAAQERAWIETSSIFKLSPKKSDVERIYADNVARQCRRYGVAELSPIATNRLWQAAEAQARREMLPRVVLACREIKSNPDTTNLLFGVMSPAPLRRTLGNILPEAFPKNGPVVYASALKCGKDREFRTFRLNDHDRDSQVDMLCASAAIPVVFPPVRIDGALWHDGGWEERGGDRSPVGPILSNHPEIKTVVVVYLHDDSHLPPGYRQTMRRKVESAGVRLVEVVPSRNIGGPLDGWFGVFDSTPETMQDLMACGYNDAKKVLQEFKESERKDKAP